jgi:hypothetical protein
MVVRGTSLWTVVGGQGAGALFKSLPWWGLGTSDADALLKFAALSAILDSVVSNARGTLLVRGAAGWTSLAVAANSALGANANDVTYAGAAGQYSAQVYRAAALSLVTATPTAIPWDTEENVQGAVHSTVTNPTRFTAPIAGVYLLTAHLRYTGSALGTQRSCAIYKNGVALKDFAAYYFGANTFDLGNAVMARLAANDYLEVVGYQDSGAGLALGVGALASWAQFSLLTGQ